MFSSTWTGGTPTIVAEQLVRLRDPLAPLLEPGAPRHPRGVAAAIARALAPAEASAPTPEWLRDEQHRTARRCVAAAARYGGACLADPVGSGKTYVALAAAAMSNRGRPTLCLVPAAVMPQWRRVAAALGVTALVGSHEQASRGRLPRAADGAPGELVLVDESHRLRNPATRRYAHAARWLVGRRVLLLSATPIVNRAEDLLHQLALGVPRDALRLHGLPRLEDVVDAEGRAHPALGELVIVSARAAPVPARHRAAAPVWRPSPGMTRLLRDLSALRLSTDPAVAALLRGALVRAAASSPPALEESLRRYHRLLCHARDAAAAGGSALVRADLRRLTAGLDDQLPLWALLLPAAALAPTDLAPADRASTELAPDDLDRLRPLLARAAALRGAPDPKCAALARLLEDGRPTLIFTWSRETVRHLRDRLPAISQALAAAAWCTGERAGIGRATMPREDVLAWFGADAAERRAALPSDVRAPTVLLATDVAAEGLDLRGATRVVHYDLPWTPMRLEQREGRAARRPAAAAGRPGEVEIVRYGLPPELEAGIGVQRALARKARLPARAGLVGPSALASVWRWRAEVAERWREVDGEAGRGGIAVVRSDEAGVLAAYELVDRTAGERSFPVAAVAWIDARGRVHSDGATIAARLAVAAHAAARDDTFDVPARTERTSVGRTLSALVRAHLRSALGHWWSPGPLEPEAARHRRRLDALAREAVRARDARRLAEIERLLAVVARGHTAGERILLAEADGPAALAALGRLAPRPDAAPALEPRVAGILVFRAG